MSITRTYKAIATSGFSLGRQNLKLAKISGIATAGNTNTNNFLGFYTTSVASASTAVLGLAAAPTTTVTVPIFEIQVTKATEFNQDLSAGLPMFPGPVYCALSSTQGVYTTTTDTIDVFLEMEEWEEQIGNSISSATLSSGNALTVWSDTIAAPSAAKGLIDVIALDLGNSAGAQLYLQLFAGLAPNVGDTPKMGWCWPIPLAATAGDGVNINLTGALLLNFGDPQVGGLSTMQQSYGIPSTTNATTGTNYSACYFRVSTTPTIYTAAAANAAMIVARYVTPTN